MAMLTSENAAPTTRERMVASRDRIPPAARVRLGWRASSCSCWRYRFTSSAHNRRGILPSGPLT
jgi:hypothetical protein